MPVFDWVKSDLDYRLEDGSSTLAFISDDIPDDPRESSRIEHSSNEFELPGWEPERLAHIKSLLEAYASVDEEKLRENFAYFLQSIIPTCEEVGVKWLYIQMIRHTRFWITSNRKESRRFRLVVPHSRQPL